VSKIRREKENGEEKINKEREKRVRKNLRTDRKERRRTSRILGGRSTIGIR